MNKITQFKGQYRFLSNFHPAEVMLEGETYPTVEHAYQAAKFESDVVRSHIRCADTAAKAKRLGSKYKIREDWDLIKLAVMKGLLVQKFRHPELAALLKATGDAELIEGNWWGDIYWGVCEGVGHNHLGKLLMEIRSTL